MKKDDEILIGREGQEPEFIITYLTEEEYKDSNFEFSIQRIIGGPYEGVDKKYELEHYLRGYIKWDGCSHVWFGDENGYMHLCGVESFLEMRGLLKKLYELAEKAIGKPLYMQTWGDDYEYLGKNNDQTRKYS